VDAAAGFLFRLLPSLQTGQLAVVLRVVTSSMVHADETGPSASSAAADAIAVSTGSVSLISRARLSRTASGFLLRLLRQLESSQVMVGSLPGNKGKPAMKVPVAWMRLVRTALGGGLQCGDPSCRSLCA